MKIVISTAGRDKGKLFFALEEKAGYVLLADGKGRKLLKPKRKNIKHVDFLAISSGEPLMDFSEDKLSNSELRRYLAIFRDRQGR